MGKRRVNIKPVTTSGEFTFKDAERRDITLRVFVRMLDNGMISVMERIGKSPKSIVRHTLNEALAELEEDNSFTNYL